MYIYRIEHKETKFGPYTHGSCYQQDDIIDYSFTDQRPRPSDDGITSIMGDAKFGFKNISQLLQWFNPLIISKLKTRGFIIKKYNINDCEYICEGNKQIVFKLKETCNE